MGNLAPVDLTPDPAAPAEFARLTSPFRYELLAHCYRMLGSVHDAEDLVQETYLRAWRSYGTFEGRSSLRSWLHRIATNACLTALERRSSRPLPSGRGGPSEDPQEPLDPAQPEVAWLQPIPDALVGTDPADPAAIVVSRESVRLALVAALQHLSPKQRAVLILRDVLAYRAVEVADLLGTTTVAVNSALQRARAQLAQLAPVPDELAEPTDPDHRALLDRYVAAFETSDIDVLSGLLRDDAILEMPPFATWFTGRRAIELFLKSKCFARAGDWRMIRTRANGQPAVGAYLLGRDGFYHAYGLHVLTVTGTAITRITAFLDPDLFPAFDLPPVVTATGPGRDGTGRLVPFQADEDPGQADGDEVSAEAGHPARGPPPGGRRRPHLPRSARYPM
jgi:RNA polymerase sigma-70 factor, ECF subfamily